MPFEFHPLEPLPDVVRVRPRRHGDERGWFLESYKASEFHAAGITAPFCQDNHSRTRLRGVLRGLHFQAPPHEQGKLVRCVRGAVWDVAADVRRGSPTFGRWVAVELTEADQEMLWVPPGFAHGFCTLTDEAEVLYKTTTEYSPTHDRAVRWDDPDLAIDWPVQHPALSPKDASAPLLSAVPETDLPSWSPGA